MKITQDYVDLKHTLQALKVQVIDSLPYIGDYIPDYIDTPKQLYYFLKSKTTYQNDPRGIEYIQMAHTLLDNGGLGDCDCFTVLALSALWYINQGPLYVTIVGNTRSAPTHIYAEVFDEDKGEIVPFDLTNKTYGHERSYKFKQRLLFQV